MNYYDESYTQVINKFGTDSINGLNNTQVVENQNRYGKNIISEQKK